MPTPNWVLVESGHTMVVLYGYIFWGILGSAGWALLIDAPLIWRRGNRLSQRTKALLIFPGLICPALIAGLAVMTVWSGLEDLVQSLLAGTSAVGAFSSAAPYLFAAVLTMSVGVAIFHRPRALR